MLGEGKPKFSKATPERSLSYHALPLYCDTEGASPKCVVSHAILLLQATRQPGENWILCMEASASQGGLLGSGGLGLACKPSDRNQTLQH